MKQCFECTQEQVELLVDAISKRKLNDLEVQASLHGAKMDKSKRGYSSLEKDWDKLKNISSLNIKG